MDEDLSIRRKWTLRARGRQIVLVKRRNEKTSHVFMKAFIWSLYLPAYPNLSVEVRIRDRFKPDVVSLGGGGIPDFWGEAGYISNHKIKSLLRRYRNTHFVLAKWDTPLAPFAEIVRTALRDLQRMNPVDLINFPPDSVQRFIDSEGRIHVRREALEWMHLP
jgi:hypothetical protein